MDKGDGPDTIANYVLLRRGKRKDYFTGALPWPQKGATSVMLPLGTSAPVKGISIPAAANAASAGTAWETGGSTVAAGTRVWTSIANTIQVTDVINASGTTGTGGHYPNIYADLTAATAATINQIRQAFQTQRLLERDARGGTRYTEIIKAHFGVISPDARLQRPEYLGGSSTYIETRAVAQTSAAGLTGGNTPLAQLGAVSRYGGVS